MLQLQSLGGPASPKVLPKPHLGSSRESPAFALAPAAFPAAVKTHGLRALGLHVVEPKAHHPLDDARFLIAKNDDCVGLDQQSVQVSQLGDIRLGCLT